VLVLKNIEVKIGKKTILDSITFEANKGINVILGPNGSGKTTILRSIIGVIKIARGEIITKGSLSYVPSEFFSPSMRVIDVILSGNKRVDYDYYIKQLNIEDFLERDFSTLSSGEKKLVLIAKALAEGDNVLMDEPLANLDVKNRLRILKTLKKFDKTFLITSHELDILNYSNKVILIRKGKIIYEGSVDNLGTDLLSATYGVCVKRVGNGEGIYYKFEDECIHI